MSIPKSKMLSVSKSILAHASMKRDTSHLNNQQSQVVNVNVNPQPCPARTTEPPVTQSTVKEQSPTATKSTYESSATKSTSRSSVPGTRCIDDIYIVDPSPVYSSLTTPTPQPEMRDVDTAYAELGELKSLLNNSESVSQALILIIDLIQSNPLMINKFIVPVESTFKELITVLTGANEVDVKYNDDVGCTIGKKYKLIEDVYVVKNSETLNIRYSFPEVLRLFDRFKISTKMIAID